MGVREYVAALRLCNPCLRNELSPFSQEGHGKARQTGSNHRGPARQNISLRLGGDLLDIVPVQRDWRFGAVEQDANAAVKATVADNDAFLIGKARAPPGT
jgi:hypothetical protein